MLVNWPCEHLASNPALLQRTLFRRALDKAAQIIDHCPLDAREREIMNRFEFCAHGGARSLPSNGHSAAVEAAATSAIANALALGGTFTTLEFCLGCFVTKHHTAPPSRSSRTGEAATIVATQVPALSAYKILHDTLNR